MKLKRIIPLLIALSVLTAHAGKITTTFADVEDFTDFSVSGLSEEKTLGIFLSELEDELENFANRYIKDDSVLEIHFTDIDMVGDIQPWRNRHNADIRYIERIYPPRLRFSYVLKNPDGKVIAEGEESIADLAFDFNVIAPIRSQHMYFFYETNLLGDWIRKTIRSVSSKPAQD
jgi:hypothetical protein